MNLREEIDGIIVSHWDDEHVEATDEILKLFEKRIESIRKKEEYNSYDMGWNMGLEKVVKEMLNANHKRC